MRSSSGIPDRLPGGMAWDAYALLQTGGLEPREEKGSWLSKIYRGVIGRTAAAE